MKKYYFDECANEADTLEKEKIALECLDIANRAKFPTDFKDVYDHLFEDDSYIRLFVKDEDNQIKGFVIGCLENGFDNYLVLHIHGIIMDPSVQGKGLSKKSLEYLVSKYSPDVLTAKTHNPRFFNSAMNIFDSSCHFYPNPDEETPEVVYDIVKSDKFIDCVDSDLVYRDAYPDEKIMQSNNNPLVQRVFENLKPFDAQAIVVIINGKILERGKERILRK